MFAKGYTNIRAMIETQYGILSQMIMDIAYRYQTQLKQTEEEADRLARDNSDGDYEIYHTILNSLNDVEERSYCKSFLHRPPRHRHFAPVPPYFRPAADMQPHASLPPRRSMGKKVSACSRYDVDMILS